MSKINFVNGWYICCVIYTVNYFDDKEISIYL